jgi:hypothetical protein
MIDYEEKSDDYLIARREKLTDWLETDMSQEFIRKFHDLLEVERELTLREDR